MNPGDTFTITSGPFANQQATLVEVLPSGRYSVEVTIFGRATQIEIAPSAAGEGASPELRGDPAAPWIQKLTQRLDRVLDDELLAWWDEPAGTTPEAEWAAFVEAEATVRARRAEREPALVANLRAALEGFDAAKRATQFSAWLDTQAPRIEHPLLQAARAAGNLTMLGSPRLSEAEWDEVNAQQRARRDRRWVARKAAFSLERGQPAPAELERRRAAARDEAAALAATVRARFQASHGLRLPDHVFSFHAFWLALTDLERTACERLGVRPGGIFDRFTADDPQLLEGKQHPQHGRFYCTPPELLHALWGDTDGLHWGLFYDDPREEPAFVAGFYARDGGGIFRDGRTLLDVVRSRALRVWEGLEHDRGLDEARREKRRCELDLLLDAAAAFEPPAENVPELPARVACADGIGVLVPAATGEIPDRGPQHELHAALNDAARLEGWVTQARNDLAAGRPGFALVLGRDLHWCSNHDPGREELAAELLAAAYRALGREALAEIVELHQRTRKQGSVGAYR